MRQARGHPAGHWDMSSVVEVWEPEQPLHIYDTLLRLLPSSVNFDQIGVFWGGAQTRSASSGEACLLGPAGTKEDLS